MHTALPMTHRAAVAPTAARATGDRLIVLGLLLLAGAIAAAMTVLWQYKNAAGAQADAPPSWPPETELTREAGVPTLVMFAHPMCPCTRASLAELRMLMSEFKGRVSAHVVFALPPGVADGWEKTDLWSSAASIPGVQVHRDAAEREAHRFSAKTSGHIVFYGTDGRLLFQGGITAARGHVGDNAGRARLTSLLRAQSSERAGSDVYGCALDSPSPPAVSP